MSKMEDHFKICVTSELPCLAAGTDVSQWDFEDLMDLLNDQGGLGSFFFELEGCCLSSFLLGWLIVGSLKTLWYMLKD